MFVRLVPKVSQVMWRRRAKQPGLMHAPGVAEKYEGLI